MSMFLAVADDCDDFTMVDFLGFEYIEVEPENHGFIYDEENAIIKRSYFAVYFSGVEPTPNKITNLFKKNSNYLINDLGYIQSTDYIKDFISKFERSCNYKGEVEGKL